MNRTVLVTGTSTGFGLETALYLAERGYTVYATMRDLARRGSLDAAAAQRRVQLRVLRVDITDQASITEAVQTAVAETGGIYGLVNNAGGFLRGFFEDLDDAEIRHIYETNVFGTMAMTRAVLPYMRAARRGRIAFVTSVAGHIGAPGGSVYSSTRFTQEGFAESLYQELAPLGIYVSLVAPGITRTERWTFDSGVAARARDPQSPYATWFAQSAKIFYQAMNTSPISPRDVAEAMNQIMTVKHPKLRYIIGQRAKLVIRLRRILPFEIFERVYFGEVIRRITGVRVKL